MSSRQIKRLLRKQSARQEQQLAAHLELLGAAFCKETGLDPKKAKLVVKQEEGEVHYWYEEREDEA